METFLYVDGEFHRFLNECHCGENLELMNKQICQQSSSVTFIRWLYSNQLKKYHPVSYITHFYFKNSISFTVALVKTFNRNIICIFRNLFNYNYLQRFPEISSEFIRNVRDYAFNLSEYARNSTEFVFYARIFGVEVIWNFQLFQLPKPLITKQDNFSQSHN